MDNCSTVGKDASAQRSDISNQSNPNDYLRQNQDIRLHDRAPSMDSGDEDSDLELELGGEDALMGGADALMGGADAHMGGESRAPNGLLLKNAHTPGRSRQVFVETPRFDLVSPYKRLRLQDLTQSSMDSSQAAGECEAHSLLKSCDDDDDGDHAVGDGDDQGNQEHLEDYEKGTRDMQTPASFDMALDKDAHVKITEISDDITQSKTLPQVYNPTTATENHIVRKKKSFFHNLFGKANFSKKGQIASSDQNTRSNTISRHMSKPENKHKTPLKDVRNVSWSQDQQNSIKNAFTSGLIHAPKTPPKSRHQSTSVSSMLSPQEMRASIPYIDELCLDEDPFTSADEREFPPPPALDKDRGTSRRVSPVRHWSSGSDNSYHPDYQTLETRQICLEPYGQEHKNETGDGGDSGKDIDESEGFNVYDKIDGDEDDIESSDDPFHNFGSGHYTQGFPLSENITPTEISVSKVASGTSTVEVSSCNTSKCTPAGPDMSQNVSRASNKSAKSVGTSCSNTPGTLVQVPVSLTGSQTMADQPNLDALHNMTAPFSFDALNSMDTLNSTTSPYSFDALNNMDAASESSAFTVQTRRTTATEEISAVYDTVDTMSEMDGDFEENLQGIGANIEGTDSSTNVNNNSNSNSSNSRSTVHGMHTDTTSDDCLRASDTKLTASSGVSTRDLWNGDEVNTGSRYTSEQELPVKSRSFESTFEQKPQSSVGSLHQQTRSFSLQHLPHHNHHQQQQPQQLHGQSENHFLVVSSMTKLPGSNPRVPATGFPHHQLDIVVEQSPPREEDFDLPPGATARNFTQTMGRSQHQGTACTYTDSQGNADPVLFHGNPDIQPPLGNLGNIPPTRNPENGKLSEKPEHNRQAKIGSVLEGTEMQFPYYLDRHQHNQIQHQHQHQQQQGLRFPSEEDLQQYLHQAEVENYLRQHRELARLQQDIENADPVVSAGPGVSSMSSVSSVSSQHSVRPQPQSSASLASHRSTGSQNSASSQRQSSTGSLGQKRASAGSLKQHSFGSSYASQGRSGSAGGGEKDRAHQKHQLSSGSVHHNSRSSQDSAELSNPGSFTSKRAVLQSSGRKHCLVIPVTESERFTVFCFYVCYQFPYYLDRHQHNQIQHQHQHQQQQGLRFPSEEDLQQYLHQAEVENYLRQHRELARLQQDIENADPVVSAGPGMSSVSSVSSQHSVRPQPQSSASLASHRSTGSQNSASSQRQSSTGSLGQKRASAGSLKQHSFGSSYASQGRSGSAGGGEKDRAHQKHQLSSGSVHHNSRSSQDSAELSNPGSFTSKRAVLQSSDVVTWTVTLAVISPERQNSRHYDYRLLLGGMAETDIFMMVGCGDRDLDMGGQI
ncbi:hypothetical protein EGW08_015271 [Elysia chlorotica]|uniref:Uncharacterized protein n=1 Tax=Elysia chlorotica TaxID=188477 RepID=A0A433T5Z0_ELYCH|nr:hypothetical protein EGW08_015271 [Elysia chlorotica]